MLNQSNDGVAEVSQPKKLEVLSLKCVNCGAALEGSDGKSEITCGYCGTVHKVLKPVAVQVSKTLKIDLQDSCRNMIEIMQRSMLAGNYSEAYKYCNKALEIDTTNGAIWENKAICSFWLRSDKDIIESEAKEILTYLEAAKANDPDSTTLQETTSLLAFHLYITVWLTWLKNGFNEEGAETIYGWGKRTQKYYAILEIAFDLDPNPMYLEYAVKELSNHNQFQYVYEVGDTVYNLHKAEVEGDAIANTLGFDAAETRQRYIDKIRAHFPEWELPEAKENEDSCFPAETRVLTPSGYRKIGGIQAGDTIVSMGDNGHLTEAIVTRKKSHGKARITRISLQGNRPDIRTTAHHSFKTRDGWKRVSRLKPGDAVFYSENGNCEGLIEVKTIESDGVEPVFNLYTTGPHNFIAEGLIAHNFTEFRLLRAWLHRIFIDPFYTQSLLRITGNKPSTRTI